MSATLVLDQDYGTQTGAPTRGTSTDLNIADVNWMNSGDTTNTYSSFPISSAIPELYVNKCSMVTVFFAAPL